MRTLLFTILMILGGISSAWSAAPASLTTLQAVHALTNDEASLAHPVAFAATVTFYRDLGTDLFVQDGGVAIYVYFRAGANLHPGDRVLVRGVTRNSFRPIVVAESVTVLGHGAPPVPVAASAGQLFSAQSDCMLVAVRGVVHGAQMVWTTHKRNVYLQVLIDGGYIDAAVNSEDAGALKNLLDAQVEIIGVVNAKFDQKMQQIGIALDVQSLGDIKILSRATAGPESLPITKMDEVLGGYLVRDLTQRIRVHGTVTYYQPGSAVMLQDGAKSLWIMTITDVPLRVGDVADASGFPDVSNGYLALTHGEVRDTQLHAPIAPVQVDWETLVSGRNAFDLVSVEGRVVMEAREAAQDEYVLTTNGHLISAIYRHPDDGDVRLPPMKQVAVGAKVRVTGISMFYRTDPFTGPVASDVLLRSFDDVAVIGSPPWLSIANLSRIVGALLIIVLVVAARGWSLERKVRRQTAIMAAHTAAEAAMMRQRSRILEDINGTEPLPSILEQITELVSFQVDGAPCWCEIKDGPRLGRYPADAEGLSIIHQEIRAHSGSPLGIIFAGLGLGSEPAPHQTEALSMGARLAEVAIETRKLYSDLRRRSEFDLLTEVHNRFSLERHLDAQIEEARQDTRMLGLIYIDLDDFKLVNDLYGHRVGDLYLQNVTERMKRQLRPLDMLARLGGDEFAALIPIVHGRNEVEEIATRLERCFSDPVTVENCILQGSASCGIALYPEDAGTRDAILSAADAAMYVAKHAKRKTGQASARK
jgi:diguanylate cyclase (GGDEF)-like protein